MSFGKVKVGGFSILKQNIKKVIGKKEWVDFQVVD